MIFTGSNFKLGNLTIYTNIVSWLLFGLLPLLMTSSVLAGSFSNTSLVVSDTTPSATATYTFSYRIENAANQSEGHFISYIIYPTGFVVPNTGCGDISITINGQLKSCQTAYTDGTIARITLADDVAAGSDVVVTHTNVQNAASAGNYTFTFMRTASGSGQAIDSWSPLPTVSLDTAPEWSPTLETAPTIVENTLQVVDLVATDADGHSISYQISGGNDAALFTIGSNSGALSFASAPDYEIPADNNTDNTYEVSVTAAANGVSISENISVSVSNGNDAPTISGTPSNNVFEGVPYDFTPTASDEDVGDNLTFSITNKPSWATFSTTTGQLSGTPGNDDVGVTSGIVITVMDEANSSASLATFNLEVVNVNGKPVITGAAATSVLEGEAYDFTPTASDDDVGDNLTFSITNKPSWATFSTTTGQLSGTPGNDDVGVTSGIVITVMDAANSSASLAPFNLEVVNVNGKPVITGAAATSVLEGEAYDFTPTASDEDAGDNLTFSITNKPSWATFSTTTGQLSGTPGNDDVGVTSGIVITVMDEANSSASLAPFNLEVVNVNGKPVITGAPVTSVLEGEAYDFTPTASDEDAGDNLTFSITNKPSWATFSTTTGQLSGTPGNDDVGVTSGIVITVMDEANSSASLAKFNLEVVNVNGKPVITGAPVTSVLEGEAYDFTPTASDEDAGDNLTFSITNKPSWATFSTTTGQLSGTPGNDDVGVTSGIVITVMDEANSSASLATFNLEVVNVNGKPVITGAPVTSVLEGEAYDFTPTASDDDVGDNLTFSITNKPSWATFSTTTGQLSGTPGNDDVGVTSGIVITVMDASNSSASLAPFNLEVVNVNDDPVSQGTLVTDTLDEDRVDPVVFSNDVLLSMISDPDKDGVQIQGKVFEGTYGKLFLNEAGVWVYQYNHHIPEEDLFTPGSGEFDDFESQTGELETQLETSETNDVIPSVGEDIPKQDLVEYLNEGDVVIEEIEIKLVSLDKISPVTLIQLLQFSIEGRNDLPVLSAPEINIVSNASHLTYSLDQVLISPLEVSDIDSNSKISFTFPDEVASTFEVDESNNLRFKQAITIEDLKQAGGEITHSFTLTIKDGVDQITRDFVINLDTTGDLDGDGASDQEEKTAGSDPFDRLSYPDTDDDGVSDGLEVIQQTDPTNATSFLDSDNDGVPDYIERVQGTLSDDIYSYLDTDSDGVADYLELRQGTRLDDATDFLDSDGDGVADSLELIELTDPSNRLSYLDSDGDGVPDRQEQLNGTSHENGDDVIDSDSDGVSDYQENIDGSDPNDKNDFKLDSDGDGVFDSDELSSGTNPYDVADYLDSDKDGVANQLELSQGTNPNDPKSYLDSDGDLVPNFIEEMIQVTSAYDVAEYLDSDGDRVADYVERLEQTDPKDATSYLDSDADGVPDYVEMLRGTDPFDASDKDSDGDGVTDLLELKEGTDSNDINSFLDTDGDFVPDQVELLQWTDPTDPLSFSDLDEDGVSDAEELRDGTDINDNSSFVDTDGDAVSDRMELLDGTDPSDPTSFKDTDGDGIPDVYELRYEMDPLSPATDSSDMDGDGLSDLSEYQSGTNPALDSVPPELLVDDVINVQATRIITSINEFNLLGQKAIDAIDGEVELEFSKLSYKAGSYRVEVIASDAAENQSSKEVVFNVLPAVELNVNSTLVERIDDIKVVLKPVGEIPLESMDVPLQLQVEFENNPQVEDFEVTVKLLKGMSSIDVPLASIRDLQQVKRVVVSSPLQLVTANAGVAIEVTDANISPVANIDIYQNGVAVSRATRFDGEVTVIARVLELNASDTHRYQWWLDGELQDLDSAQLIIDPTDYSSGTYQVEVTVTDSGTPPMTVVKSHNLVINDDLIFLDDLDSDGDGLTDRVEGLGDSDRDGIMNYLDDQYLPQNMIIAVLDNTDNEERNELILISDAGTRINAGMMSMYSETGVVQTQEAGSTDVEVINVMIENEAQAITAARSLERSATFVSNLVVQMPASLAQQLQTNRFVFVPRSQGQSSSSPSSWRPFESVKGNYVQFASASELGCPSADSALFSPQYELGQECINIGIVDGGDFDMDGEADNRVEYIFYIGKALVEDEPQPELGKKSGGSISLLAIWASLLIFLSRLTVKSYLKKKGQVVRLFALFLSLILITGCGQESTKVVDSSIESDSSLSNPPDLGDRDDDGLVNNPLKVELQQADYQEVVTTTEAFSIGLNLKSPEPVSNLLITIEAQSLSGDEKYVVDVLEQTQIDNVTTLKSQNAEIPSEVISGTYKLVALFEEQTDEEQGVIIEAIEPLEIGLIQVVQATSSNIKIASLELENSSFVLGNLPDDTAQFNQGLPDIALSVSILSEYLPTFDPFDLQAVLVLPDGKEFPLDMSSKIVAREPQADERVYDEETGKVYEYLRAKRFSFEAACEDSDGNQECEVIGEDSDSNVELDLRLTEAAYAALARLEQDTLTTIRVTLDPDHSLSEWNNNKADNTMEVPVMYLANPEIEANATDEVAGYSTTDVNPLSSYARSSSNDHDNLFKRAYKKTSGSKGKARIEFKVEGSAGYTPGTTGLPKYVKLRAYGWVKAWVKGYGKTFVKLDTRMKGEDVDNTAFSYSVDILGKRIFQGTEYIPDYYKGWQDIYSTRDDDTGEEEYRKYADVGKKKKLKKWGVSFKAFFGIRGEVGLFARSYARATESFTVKGRAGPYAKLQARVEGSGKFGPMKLGTEASLDLINLRPQMRLSGVLVPGDTVSATASLDMVTRYLDGRVKFKGKFLFVKKSWTIFKWSGYSIKKNLWVKQAWKGWTTKVEVPNSRNLVATYRLHTPKPARSDERYEVTVKGNIDGKSFVKLVASCPIVSGLDPKTVYDNISSNERQLVFKAGLDRYNIFAWTKILGWSKINNEWIKLTKLSGKRYKWIKKIRGNKNNRYVLPHKDCSSPYALVDFFEGSSSKNLTLSIR